MQRTIKAITAAGIAATLLAGCMNDGTVADQHAVTFESAAPSGGPTQAQARAALDRWLIANVPDGANARDVSVGPVRYAKVILIPPQDDFFVCATFTAKNQFGTYMPPEIILMTMRVYNPAEGWAASLIKTPVDGAYRQYCSGQSHG